MTFKYDNIPNVWTQNMYLVADYFVLLLYVFLNFVLSLFIFHAQKYIFFSIILYVLVQQQCCKYFIFMSNWSQGEQTLGRVLGSVSAALCWPMIQYNYIYFSTYFRQPCSQVYLSIILLPSITNAFTSQPCQPSVAGPCTILRVYSPRLVQILTLIREGPIF